MKLWVILYGSRKDPKTVFADREIINHEPAGTLNAYDRIEIARERKAVIQQKWPHLKAWIVELDYENKSEG